MEATQEEIIVILFAFALFVFVVTTVVHSRIRNRHYRDYIKRRPLQGYQPDKHAKVDMDKLPKDGSGFLRKKHNEIGV